MGPVGKEDYYNEHSGWDTEGLIDDLRVAKARAWASYGIDMALGLGTTKPSPE